MPTRRSRRQFLSAACAAFTAGAIWPSALRAGDGPESGAFKFIAVNDVHYRDKECSPWLTAALKQMASHEGVEFCLLLGDLAEDGTAEQLSAVRDIVKASKLETRFIIGNHDYTADGGRKPYEELFPKTLNYAFDHRGWQFIACDSTQGRAAKDTVIALDSLDFLKTQVAKLNKERPTVLFTHFPLGWLVPSSPGNRADALAAFEEVNLQAVFNGHFHSRSVRTHKKATITTNQCCSRWHPNHDGTKEKGYYLCEAKDGQISRKFVEFKP